MSDVMHAKRTEQSSEDSGWGDVKHPQVGGGVQGSTTEIIGNFASLDGLK